MHQVTTAQLPPRALLPALLLALISCSPGDDAAVGQAQDPDPPRLVDPAGRPRSVLFYVIDTLRADHLGLYGYERETDPFLAELAASAVVFERCYSQAPWTKPSVAAILTGRYPGEIGIHELRHQLPDSYITFPEQLAASGYSTAGFSVTSRA